MCTPNPKARRWMERSIRIGNGKIQNAAWIARLYPD
jgi:hypothetical protein